MIALFKRYSKEQNADYIANYLPNSKIWAAKKITGTRLRKLLLGLACSISATQYDLESVWEQIDPSTTTNYISEWESAVGIPDECFLANGSLDERRRDVLIKLNSAIQTREDFIALASLLGITINILSGSDFNALPYDIPFLVLGSQARFTMVVEVGTTVAVLPYDIPFLVGDAKLAILKCLFAKLKPANSVITYIEV